jgi:polyribonucleotide nucleotidyltransferase
VYHGKVVRVMDFGAFVEIMPGRDGLLHISQISDERVEDIHTVLKEGDEFEVKLTEIDSQGRLNLSKKVLNKG